MTIQLVFQYPVTFTCEIRYGLNPTGVLENVAIFICIVFLNSYSAAIELVLNKYIHIYMCIFTVANGHG